MQNPNMELNIDKTQKRCNDRLDFDIFVVPPTSVGNNCKKFLRIKW